MNRTELIRAITKDCMFTDDEVAAAKGDAPEGAVLVKGITYGLGFHPARLAANVDRIREAATGLHPTFYNNGWSFLNLCMDANGEQWGEHSDCEMLCCLAIAAGLGKWIMLEMASIMPGGMPYFAFTFEPDARQDIKLEAQPSASKYVN